jgi:PIN domain nuclease of toxin-antitoxin system
VIVIDTHVLVWIDREERKLGKKSRLMIERKWAGNVIAVSAIPFWKIGTRQRATAAITERLV